MNSQALLDIIAKGENNHVEFKSSFNDEVIVSLVAFANSKGGHVLVGVSDNGKVKGVQLGKETLVNWVNEVKNKTAPVLIPDVEVISIGDKNVVVISCDEYPVKPISTKGRYYKRVENSNHPLLVSEVVDLHLKSINMSWDSFPDPVHVIDDISLEKV